MLKHSIINGFCTHNFLTFAKRFLSNVCKTQKYLLATLNPGSSVRNIKLYLLNAVTEK